MLAPTREWQRGMEYFGIIHQALRNGLRGNDREEDEAPYKNPFYILRYKRDFVFKP